MLHEQRPLRFECTGCGACCAGSDQHYIETTDVERARIREALGVGLAWFRRRYLVALGEGALGLRIERGRCVFLRDNRCRIYAVRPVQCRTYPWWPELLVNAAVFAAEGARCEGIGRGAVVPRARIETALRQQRHAGASGVRTTSKDRGQRKTGDR